MLYGRTHHIEDTRLLSALRSGSTQAFSALYNRYWADVLDEAYRRLQDLDQAKDVAQEVFASLWSRGPSLEIANLPAWLYTVVRNQVLKAMRTRGRFVSIGELVAELDRRAEDADAGILKQELVAAFERLVESLPQQQRTIFLLRYQEELSANEIAERLNLAPKTVRNHLGRALLRLKAHLLLIQLLFFIAGK